jgi:tRNA threonylcarbamoyladenosine biosynthesis protein TsaE
MSILPQQNYYCATEAEMLALGKTLAPSLQPGQLIFLQGDLGAGKTTLVRGILQGLGYQGVIKSPTFTLVESYELPTLNIYHFDLYRLTSAEELAQIGFRDYLSSDAVCLIEWPKKAAGYLPTSTTTINIEFQQVGRSIVVSQFE